MPTIFHVECVRIWYAISFQSLRGYRAAVRERGRSGKGRSGHGNKTREGCIAPSPLQNELSRIVTKYRKDTQTTH